MIHTLSQVVKIVPTNVSVHTFNKLQKGVEVLTLITFDCFMRVNSLLFLGASIMVIECYLKAGLSLLKCDQDQTSSFLIILINNNAYLLNRAFI